MRWENFKLRFIMWLIVLVPPMVGFYLHPELGNPVAWGFILIVFGIGWLWGYFTGKEDAET